MGEVVGTAVVEIHARIDALEKEIRRGAVRGAEKAGKDSGKIFGSSFKRNVAAFTGGLLGAGAIVGSIRSLQNLGKESLKAAQEQAGAQAVLQKAVKNAGQEFEVYGQTVDAALQAESLRTGFTDNDLIPAFIRLLRVTEDNTKAMETLRLAQDLARQQGIGVSIAALAISKAYQGNIGALGRYGIVLKGVTSETTKAEKATLALARIEEVAGGTALTFADSDAGKLERAAVTFDEIKETIGNAILPTVAKVGESIAKWFANPENQKRVEKGIQNTAETVEETIGIAGKIGSALATPFKGFVAAGKLFNEDLQSAADLIDRINRTEELQNKIIERRTQILIEQQRLRRTGATEGLTSAERGITGTPNFPQGPANRAGLQSVAGVSTFDPNRQRQIAELQAALTESDADNVALARARRENLQKQIESIGEASGKNEQDRLIRLYKELGDVSDDINSVEKAAKDARADAAEERKRIAEEDREKARQGYRDALSLTKDQIQLATLTATTDGQLKTARKREIEFLRKRVDDTKLDARERLDAQLELAALQKEQREIEKQDRIDKRDQRFSLKEQRLQLRLQRAELTETTNDDKKAQRALIRFYGESAKQARRTGQVAKALDLESRKVSQQIALKGTESNAGGQTDFFQEAADQFRRFGSNIGRSGDPLSGQQARGQFAGLALDRGRNTSNLQGDQLDEAQTQTSLLREIRDRLRVDTRAAEGNQPPRRRSPNATDIARVNARNNLAGR